MGNPFRKLLKLKLKTGIFAVKKNETLITVLKNYFKDKLFVVIFLTACVLNTIPVVFNTFVLSLDGPAHLYNSNLIAELVRGNAAISKYVTFNTLHFTNWSGHFILALFNLAAPAWMAQKVFLILLVFFFPLSFAFFVTRVNYKSRYLSFIIFPFTYGNFFFLGFYNFLLAIIFFFLWLALIYKENRSYTTLEKILIFILFILIEGSHVFVLVIALAIFSAYLLWPVVQKNKFHVFRTLREMMKPLLNILILGGGGILLFFFYLFNSPGQLVEMQYHPVSWSDMVLPVFNISPLLSLGYDYLWATRVLFGLLVLSTLVLVIKKKLPEKKGNRNFILYSAVIALGLYVYTMLFSDRGFYIQSRFLFVFFLLWMAWISLQQAPKILQIGLIAFSVLVSSLFIDYYKKNLEVLSFHSYFIYDTGWKIEKNSRVYCINFGRHWLETHQLSYLGAENALILYDNYECSESYFPLRWKNPELIRKINHDFDEGMYSQTIAQNVDYVAVIDEPKPKSHDQKNKAATGVQNNFSETQVLKNSAFPLKPDAPKNILQDADNVDWKVNSDKVSTDNSQETTITASGQTGGHQINKALALTKKHFSKFIVSKDRRLTVYKKIKAE